MSIVSMTNFLYLYAITEHIPLYLGYAVVQSIPDQAFDPHVGVLYSGPYITKMACGMSRMRGTKHMRFMGSIVP